ncbi:hypothetical protein [Planococcus sp. YIM B11945]|uniref:hypothetical protein n=1 Tax=Planococcus sp. YIM B11945 TaxID=3435410 RepID=UPI003D7EE29C
MIEIDESTKDIMSELEESIMESIKKSFSSSIEKSIKDQTGKIQQINEIVHAEMENMKDEVTLSFKPISRMSRDVEDTLRSVMKLEKQYTTQMQAVQTLQHEQLEIIQKEISSLIYEFEKQNADLFKEGLDNFKKNNSLIIEEFALKVSIIEKDYTNDLNVILIQVKEHLQLLENVATKLSQKEEYFNQLSTQLDEQKKQQQRMFDEQQHHLSTTSNEVIRSLREEAGIFSNKLTTELTTTMNTLKLTQSVSNDALAQSLKTSEKIQSKILEDSITTHRDELQSNAEFILDAINQKISSQAFQARINEMESTVLEAIDAQLLFAKLAEIEKDLAYQRLPFYKKWFVKREDF